MAASSFGWSDQAYVTRSYEEMKKNCAALDQELQDMAIAYENVAENLATAQADAILAQSTINACNSIISNPIFSAKVKAPYFTFRTEAQVKLNKANAILLGGDKSGLFLKALDYEILAVKRQRLSEKMGELFSLALNRGWSLVGYSSVYGIF